MNKKKKNNPDMPSGSFSNKQENENPDKRTPNPDDPYEETGPPIKEMPTTGGPHHPHQEEILDTTPK